MKIAYWLTAATMLAGIGFATAADAQDYRYERYHRYERHDGWHSRDYRGGYGWHRRCHIERRGHHHVTVCYR